MLITISLSDGYICCPEGTDTPHRYSSTVKRYMLTVVQILRVNKQWLRSF